MDQDNFIKEEPYHFNDSLNIQENGTIFSEIKEEMDPMPVYDGHIKDDKELLDNFDIDENQENSNTAETVNKTHLSKYIESVHERIKPFKCNICGLETARQPTLQKHIESVHEGIKPFKCNICNFQTSRKHYLKKHIATVHEGIKPFKCESCGFETGENSTLKKHIEAVHEKNKPFKCNICHFEFAHKGDLKKHTDYVHEGIKPFECHICDYKAARKDTFKQHIDSVHEGIKPFKCEECDYEASYKTSLKKHTESVHKGIKGFKCNIDEDFDGVTNPVKMELSELGKVSDLQDRMKRLLLYITLDSKTGLEACSFCQKVYQGPDPSTRQRKLMDHIDSVHLKVRS